MQLIRGCPPTVTLGRSLTSTCEWNKTRPFISSLLRFAYLPKSMMSEEDKAFHDQAEIEEGSRARTSPEPYLRILDGMIIRTPVILECGNCRQTWRHRGEIPDPDLRKTPCCGSPPSVIRFWPSPASREVWHLIKTLNRNWSWLRLSSILCAVLVEQLCDEVLEFLYERSALTLAVRKSLSSAYQGA